jgi:hypothetical protein
VKRRGKKTIAWEKARAELKKQFLHWGVISCEFPFPHHCWRTEGLSFAHSKKRRNIVGDELMEVALLCPIAHEAVERLPEKEMCEIIRNIIKHRQHGNYVTYED